MKTYTVKNDKGTSFEVDEDKIGDAEKDGFLPVVSNGKDEHRVSFADMPKATADGFAPIRMKTAPKEENKGILETVGKGLNPYDLVTTAAERATDMVPGKGLITRFAANVPASVEYLHDKAFGDGNESYSDAYDNQLKAVVGQQDKQRNASYLGGKLGDGVGILGNAAAPGAKTALGRISTNVGMAAVDGATRGDKPIDFDEAAKEAKTTGLVSAALESVPLVGKTVKALGNPIFGISKEATAKYLENPKFLNEAPELREVTDSFLSKADDVRAKLSNDSGKSFEVLKNYTDKTNRLTDPLLNAADTLKEKGIIGSDRKKALSWLADTVDQVEQLGDHNGQITLDKGKQLLSVLDAEIQKLSNKGADAQVLKVYGDARKQISDGLKATSPEYAEIMSKLSDETENLKGISDKFRSDGGADALMKRISSGKDTRSLEALQAFDEKNGTNYAQELQDAALAKQFTNDSTNGSRRTTPGAIMGGVAAGAAGMLLGPLGAAIATPIGIAAGTAGAAYIDKNAGAIWSKILDGSIKVGPYKKLLEDAAKKGPAALGIVHKYLMDNQPAYAKAVGSQS